MKRMNICIAVVLTLGLVQFAFAQSRRKGGPDPAEWAPAQAIAYLGVTDTQRFWTDFKKTTNYKMMTDKELTEAGGEAGIPGAIVRILKERLGKMLDVAPDEIKNPFGGPLAVYVMAPPGGGPDDIEAALITGIGDTDLMEDYFDTIVARLQEEAEDYETTSAAGETIHVFTLRHGEGDEGEEGDEEEADWDFEEEGAGPGDQEALIAKQLEEWLSLDKLPPKFALCLTEQRLIATSSADHVKSVLVREKGNDTLATADDHKALLEHLRPTGEVRLLVNLPRVFEMVKAEAEGEGDELRQWLGVIGAGSLRSVVGHMRVGRRSYDLKFELLFLMSGERTGLAKLLSMENRDVAPDDSVSASTSIFASFNINPPRMLDDIVRMIAQNDPQAAEEFRASMEQVPLDPEKPPVNLRTDLIDHLAGPLTISAGISRPYGAGSLKGLFAIGHRDREAIARFVSLVPGTTTRDFRGTQIYQGPDGISTIAVDDDRTLIGTPSAVETTLAADSSTPLAEDSTFRRALRVVPKQAWGVFYMDQRKFMEGFTELAANPSAFAGDPLAPMLTMMLQISGADFSDTAQSRKMLEYYSALILTAARTPEGVQFTLVDLRPAEE